MFDMPVLSETSVVRDNPSNSAHKKTDQPTIVRRQLLTDDISKLQNLPPVLARVLAARGIACTDELVHKLSELSKPCQKGLEAATALLYQALQAQQKVLIIGDFDADGATSTVLAVECLQAFGLQQVDYLVPNRFEFGYGLSPEIVQVAYQQAPDLLITVDNGISSHEGVNLARELGMKVIITDHHLPAETLPNADAIVNPNQPGCEFPSKTLAGVGVIFYVMVALRSALTAKGWFEREQITPPNMAQFLDLVAIGTIADLVPLDHNNRILVQQGLTRIRQGACRVGVKALFKIANRQLDKVVSSDIGFALAPRLNAAGRLDDISIGINCLLSQDETQALELAAQLDSLNKERRAIEASMKVEALRELEARYATQEQLPLGLCAYDASWHPGVVGILASRLKECYFRPAVVFAVEQEEQTLEASIDISNDQTLLKGSARSIPGLHLKDALALIDTRHPGLILKFGGHAMAAGLSIERRQFRRFQAVFNETLSELLTPEQLARQILTDGPLAPNEFTLELADRLKNLLPWGQGLEEPVFDGDFDVIQWREVGNGHVKSTLAVPGSNQRLEAIAFNALKSWPADHHRIKAVYRLDVNLYNGRSSLQLMLDSVRVAW